MNTQQIDIAVDNKVNVEIADSPNKGRQHHRYIAKNKSSNVIWENNKKPKQTNIGTIRKYQDTE